MAESKRRILLVDDEIGILKTVGKRLEVEGFEVVTATNGPEAIEKALACRPNLIVLDLMLPGQSGFEVCELLKQDRNAKAIPIITVFSGRSSQEDADRCLELGAAAYVQKGRGATALVAEIKTLLDQADASS